MVEVRNLMIHYVYAQLDEGEPVYIGVGKYGRAWETRTGSRKPDHAEWMKSKLPEMEIQWIATGLDKAEAHKFEAILINKVRPRFNKLYQKGKDNVVP